MRAVPITIAIIALCLAGTPAAQGQFTPGHVFVAGNGGDGEGGCDWGEPEGIVEVDLATGDITTFADCSDGINWPGGLRFTPDGGRLLTLMTGTPDDRGWVQAFNPDGTSEIILDESDGLYRPVGSNGLAFDRAGNLYVLDRALDAILRFPIDGGPGTIFADAEDGIDNSGGLAFAPNGDLFYAGPDASAIIRIAPDGESSVFDDTLSVPRTIAIDREGNIFVAQVSLVYRYDNGDPDTLRVLASGFTFGVEALTLSHDETVLYVTHNDSTFLYGVDPVDGTTTPLATFGPEDMFVSPYGIAVAPPIFGDMDGDLDVDPFDFAAFEGCVTGPGARVEPECRVADLDWDNDVDFADFRLMQSAYGGS